MNCGLQPTLSGVSRLAIAARRNRGRYAHENSGTMSKKVVARYQDGRIIKGTSLDVDPNRTIFHVRPAQGPAVEVNMNDLKALFFVKSLDGDSARNDSQNPNPADPRNRGSSIVRLEFADGESITGLTIAFPPRRQFFFVLPVDSASNNIRMLINRDAVTNMEHLTAA